MKKPQETQIQNTVVGQMAASSQNLRRLLWPLDKWDALVITITNNFITVSVYLADWLSEDTKNHIETTQIIKINVGSKCEERTGVSKEKTSQSGVENQQTYVHDCNWLDARYIT